MTIAYKCNECRGDCGTRAKVETEYLHFCSYRCAKTYFEKQEMTHEEQDKEVRMEYWSRQKDYVAGR